jgi:hypothetical protein
VTVLTKALEILLPVRQEVRRQEVREMSQEAAVEARVPQSQLPLSPTTTAQDDMTKAGQRKINLIWEYTQATISIMVVTANVLVAVYAGTTAVHPEFPPVLSNTLFLVVGFYFSRTNHAAIGGVGAKPSGEYEGR